MAVSRMVALGCFFVAAGILVVPTRGATKMLQSIDIIGYIFCLGAGALVMHLYRYYLLNETLIITGKEGNAEDDGGRSSTVQQRLSGNSKMIFLVRTDLGMGKGKIAAQCGHAAVSAYRQIAKHSTSDVRLQNILAQWQDRGQTKIACRVDSEDEASYLYRNAREAGLVATAIHDAGRTQIASGSLTVVAIGPGDSVDVDRITGHLRLL
eukprot:Lankesteria_metandrocarpae@DN3272_c1_g1_i1.p1